MKRRMVRAIVLLVIAIISLVIFIGLYVDEKRRVQETYRAQLEKVKAAAEGMADGLSTGYEEAQAIVDAVDKMGS